MEVAEYIDKKKQELSEKYGDDLVDNTWNEIRSQIKSGFQLGLNEEDCDMFASPKYNYAQREVIKFACFSGISKDYVEKLIIETDSRKLPYQGMIKLLDELRYSEKSDDKLSKQLHSVIEQLEKLDDRPDGEPIQRDDLIFLSDIIVEKTKENEMLKQCIDKLKEENESLVARNNELREKTNQGDAPVKQKKLFFHNKIKTTKNVKEKNAKGDRNRDFPVDFKICSLPEGFNLSSYLLNSKLSSSQMEVIAMAVRLGINESLIKQMVDSECDASQLKQVLEVLVVQMDNKQHNTEDIPIDDIELF